ncbi:hypothetical protein HIM_02453 [Hirsutella minnesotensis 3608]|nr:hypothetical protein HIM_02453 [Hirsutella minnesotensis 3608]
MVIGLLAIAAIPTVTGVGQAVSAQKKQNAAAKEQEKFHLSVLVSSPDGFRDLGTVVLRGGRLVVNVNHAENQQPPRGHKFCGYHFPYPGPEQHRGLVSTIADDPPMLNWIYVNQETGAVQHGGRKDTLGHVIGPWGWSQDETWLTLEDEPGGFVVKQVQLLGEEEGGDSAWGIFWEARLKRAQGEDGEDGKEDGDDGDDEEEEVRHQVQLRRRPLLGMESRYVRD